MLSLHPDVAPWNAAMLTDATTPHDFAQNYTREQATRKAPTKLQREKSKKM
jgi:hypothetical protein